MCSGITTSILSHGTAQSMILPRLFTPVHRFCLGFPSVAPAPAPQQLVHHPYYAFEEEEEDDGMYTDQQRGLGYPRQQPFAQPQTVDVLLKLSAVDEAFFSQGGTFPCRISVYASTGWHTPPKEVLSIDAELSRRDTTVRFEHLPIGTALMLNVRGSVTVLNKGPMDLCTGLEGYLGSRCEVELAPVPKVEAPTPDFSASQEWGDGARRMQRASSLEEQQRGEAMRGNGSGYAGGSHAQSEAPKPLHRKVSVASQETMGKLGTLQGKVDALRSEFDGIMGELKANRVSAADRPKVAKQLQLLRLNFNRLQELEIDSIQTMGLKSGQAEAKAMRKGLTKIVQGTVDEIERVLKHLG